jgi:hypothetical protein
MRTRAKFWGGVAVLYLSSSAGSAAADSEAGRKAAAESLFQRGVELVGQGKFEDACRQFEASQELDSALGTMLHLGDCYEREGRTGSAWALFREARSLAGATGQGERERLAAERANALEPKLSYVVMNVVPQTGLVLRLNGTAIPAASFGEPVPVDPGEQRVEAALPGAVTYELLVRVPAGPSTVTFRIPPLEKRVPGRSRAPLSAPERGSGEPQRVGGFVALGLGGAALAAGGVLAFLAREKNEESLAECDDQNKNACSAEGVRLRHEARGFAGTATVTGVVGGVLAASGVVLVLTAPKDSKELVIGPAVGSNSAAFELRGAF